MTTNSKPYSTTIEVGEAINLHTLGVVTTFRGVLWRGDKVVRKTRRYTKLRVAKLQIGKSASLYNDFVKRTGQFWETLDSNQQAKSRTERV